MHINHFYSINLNTSFFFVTKKITSLSFSRSIILSDSETETIDDIESIRSNTIKQKQRQTTSTRKNRSHTTFFCIEADDPNIAYCKICEINFLGTNKTAFGYNRKGGNTTNLIAHLRDKHNITKDISG